jgi:hypothetical protein
MHALRSNDAKHAVISPLPAKKKQRREKVRATNNLENISPEYK